MSDRVPAQLDRPAERRRSHVRAALGRRCRTL